MLLVIASGCAADPATVDDASAVESAPPADVDIAPYPYTAEQIRDAMPVGLRMKLKMETGGEPTVIRHQSVVEADGEGCTMEFWSTDETGTAIRERRRARSTWAELRGHASFPDSATEITRDIIALPSGEWSCNLYTVQSSEGGGLSTSRFWFADDKPGMPVRYEMERDGRLVFRLTLLEQKQP
jgi:hypothetical protein